MPPPEFGSLSSRQKRGATETRELVQVPRMSKQERRQLFALKVAKEEEERQRRQQEDSWQQHQAQCLSLGLDPYVTLACDSRGFPIIFDPHLGHWQPCTVTPQPQQQVIVNGTAFPEPEVPLQSAPVEPEQPEIPQPDPEIVLPPKWRWARDPRGRIYYFHVKERNSQWLPPAPEHIGRDPDSSPSSSESSSAESSYEEDDDIEDVSAASVTQLEYTGSDDTNTPELIGVKRRRDGLVQERIISVSNEHLDSKKQWQSYWRFRESQRNFSESGKKFHY